VDGYTNVVFSGFPTVVFARILGDVVEYHPALSGLYHVASDPISKYDLLARLCGLFRPDLSIRPLGELVCNRSLDGSEFRRRTSIVAPTWDELVESLFRDAAPYEEWRHKRATA
jgi:dTDP-4-dehydrorhamnose reductase